MPDIIHVKPEWARQARLSKADYQRLYRESLENPETFWALQAQEFVWHAPWQKVKDARFAPDVQIAWFTGAKTNLSENCLDRHLAQRADKPALLWEGDDPSESETITYRQLHSRVCQAANALKALGVRPGDRVTLYLPMIPEAAIAMLACARIGAVHNAVFAGFSADALKTRIEDSGSRIVITADEGRRGGKTVALKTQVDEAVKGLPDIRHVLVVRRTGASIPMQAHDLWWHDAIAAAGTHCPPEPMDAEAPLFLLYTSGSTGKPKGMLHTTGGYMVWAGLTHRTIFDLQEEDIYWCTADIGWVTGHSYGVYGPLLNGSTTLMFEGVPHWPDFSRFWQIVDKYKVSIFYTAPTAIRALMREGDAWVQRTSRQSLRVLGSVGEPINPEAWKWFYRVVGQGRCPVTDTWWQTETGGHMIAPIACTADLKPGSAGQPFFGVQPVLVDQQGAVVEGEAEGLLCIADSWPGQARAIWNNPERFHEAYFAPYPGYYFTGDGARRDTDGFYWITGRVDDVLNVSGHRLGTAEIESALVAHEAVAEAAVVGMPHDIKGQGIYAYVVLNAGREADEALAAALKKQVRMQLSPIAAPDVIHITQALPKTRSGKIMRRILRKIAEGATEGFGDTSTLTDPGVVDALIQEKQGLIK